MDKTNDIALNLSKWEITSWNFLSKDFQVENGTFIKMQVKATRS